LELISLLKQAYKKLKSHLYTDKTLLKEKIELAKFESSIDNKLVKLSDAIQAKDISQWLELIDYTLIPKKLKENTLQDSYYTNLTKQEKYDVESINIFIYAPIELHLISTLWTMLIGEKLDIQLHKEVQGNRLYRDKNNHFQNDSYKLFRPYYEGYQSFRDNAITMATALHKQKLDVTVLNIDIQEFYYNIDFNFESLKSLVKEDKYSLNKLMQQVHDKYHEKIKDIKPKEKASYKQTSFLPIGLVSSSVIANYVLANFDNDVLENLKPEYYSRYVDDMIFIFSNANVDLKSKILVSKLLSSNLKKTKIKNVKESTELQINSRKFKLQNKKVRVFQFYKTDSISLLHKFKEKIDENSSFFNFMPDDQKLFKTLESSSYSIFYNDSENKLSSLIGTAKDSLKISRNLTGVLTTVSSSRFDDTHLKLYNQQIQNVFSGKNIFELRLYWEKVFTYLYITKSDELFLQLFKDFYGSIKNIENTNRVKLIQDTQKYLLNTILFVVAPNPKHFTDVLMKKIIELDIIELDITLDKFLYTNHISPIRDANLFASHLMTYPLLNYFASFDTDEFVKLDTLIPINYLTQKIELDDIKLKIEENKKVNYSPKFIHYHEIILLNHYLHINHQANKEENFYSTHTEEVFNSYKTFNQLPTLSDESFPDKHKTENLYIIDRNIKENNLKLKIGIVSIKTSLKDIETSYTAKPNLSYERLQGIFDILNRAIESKHKVDLLVFPEVSIPYAWVHLLARFAKKNDIGIVFGVEHIKVKNKISNYTCVMLPFSSDTHTSLFINFEAKKHFAPDEKIDIESRGFTTNENKDKTPTLYKWRNSVFSTFNCYELTDIEYRSSLVGKVDFLIAIEYNKDTNYFSNIIDSLSRDIHCYIVQVNTSDYGDSRIVQPSKTESKDLVKLKGGENIYLVVDTIDINKLRKFQAKGHCLQKMDKNFKLTPPEFESTRN
jgi:hypothetical protein